MNTTRTASPEKTSRPKAKAKAKAKSFFQHNLDLDNFATWLRDHAAERRMGRLLSNAIKKTTKLRFLGKEI